MSIAKFAASSEAAMAAGKRLKEVIVCSDSRMMPDPLERFDSCAVVRRVAGAVLTPQKAEAIRGEIAGFKRRFPDGTSELIIIGHGPFNVERGEVEEHGPGMCGMTHGDEAAAKIKAGLAELSLDADAYARSLGAQDFVSWFGKIERPDSQVRKDIEAAKSLVGADSYSGYVCDLRTGMLGHVAGCRAADVESAFARFAEEKFMDADWRQRAVAEQNPCSLALASPEFGRRAHRIAGANYPGEVFVVTVNDSGLTPTAVKSCLYALMALKTQKLDLVSTGSGVDGIVAKIKADGLLGPLVQKLVEKKELATGVRPQ